MIGLRNFMVNRNFKMKQRCLLVLLLSGLVGCSSIATNNTASMDGSENITKPADPNRTTRVLPGSPALLDHSGEAVGRAVASSVGGAVANIVVEQLTAGWSIEQTRIGDNRFRIELRRKRFTTGGDGEATQAFYRHAEQIVRKYGYAGYTVMEFGEGIDSMFLVSQRVAQGVIQVR
jgi:hypothetical protein